VAVDVASVVEDTPAGAIAAAVIVSILAAALAVFVIYQKHAQKQRTAIMGEATANEGDIYFETGDEYRAPSGV
jgi:hypothetical protein